MKKMRVEVHHLGAQDCDPSSASYPGLDRDVGDVLILRLSGGFHLNDREAITRSLKHIDHHVHPVLDERGFEHHRGTGLERLARGIDPTGIVVGEVNQHALREVLPRQGTNLGALVEPILKDNVHL
jgi:hypothetical protein